MKAIILAILICLLLPFSSSLPANAQSGDDPVIPIDSSQKISFEHLTNEQGLSSNIAWGVVQDNHGFIWIGTLDGLNRYDGNTFKIYRYDPKDPNSLGDNSVRTLARDRAGNIWIGSWGGGLNKFDPSTEQFTRYRHDPSDPQSLSGNQVFSIHEDQAGVLWVGTAAGLNRLDRETNTFTHYRHDPDDPGGLSHDGVRAVYGDQTGDLWIGSNGGGLDRLDPETGEFTHYRHDPADPRSLSSDRVASVYQDPSGIVWIGTFDNGLNRLDPESGLFTRYQYDPDDPNSLGSNDIRAVYQDGEGVLWAGGGYGGLFQFDRDTERFVRHQHDANDPSSLIHDGVTAINGEPGGTLWIATSGGGVSWLDPNRKPFALYRNSPTDPGSLSNSDVRSIYVDHTDTLWLGTPLGLNRYGRPVNGPVDPQAEPGSNPSQFTRYLHDRTDPQGLNGVYVMCMVEDQEGALWIGSLGKGLIRFDRDSKDGIDAGRFVQYENDPNDPHSLQPNLVRDLYVDSSGTLWVGTLGGGLAWFDSETETFHRYQRDPSDPNSLIDNSVMSIIEDDSGELWVATLNGLNRFVRETEEFVRYPHDLNDPDSLSHNNALELFVDREGVLWVGTNGGGLNRFEKQDERFIHYTKSDGLPSDMITGITQDDQGFLWISTSQGLSKFDPRSETFRNYDASDGLQSNQFNINAVARNSSGELFFGGVAGFNSFHPADIKDSPAIPPVVITDFQLANRPVGIGGDSVLQKSILATEEVVLSYQDRVISFEFAALNYSSPEKNRYRYKLEGFDEEWAEVGSDRRFVTYTNLDPGDYVFRVLGSNNDGVWNEEGTSLAVTITPPWWQTWLFRGGVILLLVGLVVGGFVWQRASARRRERQLEAQVAERTYELDGRVKELDCLYSISSLAGQAGISLDEVLQGTVALLPPAVQYPEAAYARLDLDGQEFKTDNYRQTPWQLSAPIMVRRQPAGQVEIGYLEEMPGADQGPFHDEERLLVDAVAERMGRITERKQAEEALGESEAQYRDLVENMNDVIYALDESGKMTYISPAVESLIGYSPAEVMGRKFAEFFYPEDLGRVRQSFGMILAGRSIEPQEYRVVTRPGDIRWIRTSSRPVFLQDQIVGVQGVLADITDKKQAEEALQGAMAAAERARRLEAARRQEAERRRQIAEVLGDVVTALNSDIALGEVLHLIARESGRLLGADAVVIGELESATGAISILAAHGLPAGPIADSILPPSAEALMQAATSHRPVVVPDVTAELSRADQEATVSWADGYRVLAAVPIIVDGEIFGGLLLYYTRPRLLSPEEIELADVLGDHVALAMENARLRAEVEQAAVVAERSRIAGELHDSVTQALYTSSLIAETLPAVWRRQPEEALRSLDDLRDLTQGALAEMRALLVELRPGALAGRRLSELLHQLTAAMSSRTDLPITTTVSGERALPERVKIALYRIAQEALNNVSKHARATRAWVTLQIGSSGATLRIRDDGRGFDPEAVSSHRMGLNIMGERAEAIGATISIESQPGQGTEVAVTWAAESETKLDDEGPFGNAQGRRRTDGGTDE